MMVSNIFRPPYITLIFSHNTYVYHTYDHNAIVTMADSNTFSFYMCNFGIISDLKKKKKKIF